MNGLFKNVWVKCISVLLIISVIAGGLLAVLNDLLFVPPEERLKRAVQAVYSKEVDATELPIEENFSCGFGKIENLYTFSDDGKSFLLFKSTGEGGYHNGTVTLWILVVSDVDGKPAIQSVTLAESTKQTLMSKLTGEFYSAYSKIPTEEILNGEIITADKNDGHITNVVSGATYSSNAADNAVNTVLAYLNQYYGGAQS